MGAITRLWRRVARSPAPHAQSPAAHDPTTLRTPPTATAPAFRGFENDAQLALAACRQWNPELAVNDATAHEALVARAVAFGYLRWPKKIRQHVQGRSVLDVGCGTGLHAIGLTIVGCRRYVGVDPRIALDQDHAKNANSRKWEAFGWTPRQIMGVYPHVELVPGSFETAAPDERIEVALMHNVTEHLQDLEAVLKGIARRLAPDGKLIFNHHNFGCWNGHHMRPRHTGEIDPTDARQQALLDWRHLRFDPPSDHYIRANLNRVRLDELRRMVDRLLVIETWDEIPSTERLGGGRLTAAIEARHPAWSRRELTTQHVFCVARPR